MSALAAALSSRRFRVFLPWISGFVLLAGILAALIVFVGNTGKTLNSPLRNQPAVIYKKPKSVPLERQARIVAGRFILTAVARRNLAEAWKLSSPTLRQGVTRAQWNTGAIPVIPYPIASLDVAPMKVDYSYPNRALLEVTLVPKQGAGVKPQNFFIELRAYGTGKNRRWLVDYWAPRGTASHPIEGG